MRELQAERMLSRGPALLSVLPCPTLAAALLADTCGGAASSSAVVREPAERATVAQLMRVGAEEESGVNAAPTSQVSAPAAVYALCNTMLSDTRHRQACVQRPFCCAANLKMAQPTSDCAC
jgi:hypothetical protein